MSSRAIITESWAARLSRFALDRLGSALYHRRMETEIARLEAQLEQFLTTHERMRAEVASLRENVATLQTENAALAAKVSVAVERLESLFQNLPES